MTLIFKMKWCFVVLFAIVLTPIWAKAQKASLHVRLIDSSATSPSDYVFELEVKNDSFPKYWVEDTATMKRDVMGNPLGLFYIVVTKYGKEGTYERRKVHEGDNIPSLDSCLKNCCNCEILEKKQAFKINLKLVENYIFEKGHYTIYVNMHPPMEVCNLCEQQEEIYSGYDFWVK
jgi:hypothetical protein